MKAFDSPVHFTCGSSMKNRFMLAPLTNRQSFENGQLSDDEFQWLTMRAQGQFGLVMTCFLQKHRSNIISKLDLPSDSDSLSMWIDQNRALFLSL